MVVKVIVFYSYAGGDGGGEDDGDDGGRGLLK